MLLLHISTFGTHSSRGVFRGVSKVSGNQSSDVTFEPIILLAELAQLSTHGIHAASKMSKQTKLS